MDPIFNFDPSRLDCTIVNVRSLIYSRSIKSFYSSQEPQNTSLTAATQLFHDAQERQNKSRSTKAMAEVHVAEALRTLLLAKDEVDCADLNMGRLIYSLNSQGFPLTICTKDHFNLDEGSYSFYSLDSDLSD